MLTNEEVALYNLNTEAKSFIVTKTGNYSVLFSGNRVKNRDTMGLTINQKGKDEKINLNSTLPFTMINNWERYVEIYSFKIIHLGEYEFKIKNIDNISVTDIFFQSKSTFFTKVLIRRTLPVYLRILAILGGPVGSMLIVLGLFI